MNVGILGSGDVAKALAKGFLERGDAVTLGTRDPAKLEDWRKTAGTGPPPDRSSRPRVSAIGSCWQRSVPPRKKR